MRSRRGWGEQGLYVHSSLLVPYLTHMKRRSASPPALRSHDKIPYKTVLLVNSIQSLLLFGAGILFISVGLSQYYAGNLGDSFMYLLLGVLVFIPGSYHLFLFMQAARGVPGYRFDQLPTLDD